jgi:hypothetical protein
VPVCIIDLNINSVYRQDGRDRKRQTRMNSWAWAKTQTNGGSTSGSYVPPGVKRIGGER